MNKYKILQRNGIPVLYTVPEADRPYEYGAHPTVAEAVNVYVQSLKVERGEYILRINRNMTRMSSVERKIRQANKLKEQHGNSGS
jgi:hypothetical protein